MKQKVDGLEGISFGITSGVITLLGVIIGLAATGNKSFTLLGLIVVGVADALSDATGMYVSEESEYVHTHEQILKSAFFTFLGKISTAVLLLIPLLFLELYPAVITSFSLGLLVVGLLGYFVAKGDKRLNTKVTILKYVSLALIVTLVAYFVGLFANTYLLL